jgi:hypothetical protein
MGDDGVSQTSFGALWWTLEERYAMPFTHLGWDRLGDLSRFNVIIIPDASSGTLTSRLGKGEALRAWVNDGGTLITFGDASQWASREDVNLTSARRTTTTGAKVDTTAVKTNGAETSSKVATGNGTNSNAALATDDLAVTSPGANPVALASFPGNHYDVILDRTHWLTFGQNAARMTALYGGRSALALAKTGTNVAVFPATGLLHRAGFTFPDNTERALRNTALIVEEPVGRGHAVLFANDPTFRGWWRAFDRVLLNAIVLGPSF